MNHTREGDNVFVDGRRAKWKPSSVPLEQEDKMIQALRTFLVAAVILSSASWSRASEQDYLPWQSVQINCFENQQTGKVSLSVQASDEGMTSLTITAFGKQYSVPVSELARIKDFPLYSVRVTHAGGNEPGAHFVSARFHRDYYDKERTLISEDAIVSVSKGKGLTVSTYRKQ